MNSKIDKVKNMPDENKVATLLNIESLINSANSKLNDLSYEVKEYKAMLDEILENNTEFQEAEKEAKKLAKLRAAARQKALNIPAAKTNIDKLKETQTQLKEIKIALSDYLSQYVSLSGTNQIEGPDGVVRQIIYTAKLVKSK
jgi:DNA repair exonuclease SbcCD ATPase subunit